MERRLAPQYGVTSQWTAHSPSFAHRIHMPFYEFSRPASGLFGRPEVGRREAEGLTSLLLKHTDRKISVLGRFRDTYTQKRRIPSYTSVSAQRHRKAWHTMQRCQMLRHRSRSLWPTMPRVRVVATTPHSSLMITPGATTTPAQQTAVRPSPDCIRAPRVQRVRRLVC